MADPKSTELGKKSLGEALTRSPTLSANSAVKLLQRVPIAFHSLFENKIDFSAAIDKFIAEFSELCVDKNGVATLTHLLTSIPKDDLIAKLREGALLRALLEVPYSFTLALPLLTLSHLGYHPP